ncbi:MAG: hypothetical protein K9K37_13010 [Desulfocapsa sp.]|nr:hypothetical protein [Desulfocapsa sp.]
MEKDNVTGFQSAGDTLSKIGYFFVTIIEGTTAEGDGFEIFSQEYGLQPWVRGSCRRSEQEGADAT